MQRFKLDFYANQTLIFTVLQPFYAACLIFFLISLAQKIMQDHPKNHDIEELTGNESEVIEMVSHSSFIVYQY